MAYCNNIDIIHGVEEWMSRTDLPQRIDDDTSDEPHSGEDDKQHITELVVSEVLRQLGSLQTSENIKDVICSRYTLSGL